MAIVNNQVAQVLMVCPDVPREDIERDLSVTGDAQATINRIFEGSFLVGAPPQHKVAKLSVSLEEPSPAAIPANTGERHNPGLDNVESEVDDHQIWSHTKSSQRVTSCGKDFGGTLTNSHNSDRLFPHCQQDDSDDDSELPDISLHHTLRHRGSTGFNSRGFSSLSVGRPVSSSEAKVGRSCHTGSASASVDSEFQSSPTKDVAGKEGRESPVVVVPDMVETEDGLCVDLTLSPQRVSPDTSYVDLEHSPSPADVNRASPLSLSSNESDDVRVHSEDLPTESQTNLRTAVVSQDSRCSNDSSTFEHKRQPSSSTRKHSDNSSRSQEDQDFSEETGFAPIAAKSPHPVGCHQQGSVLTETETMDVDIVAGRCSPISISSSEDEEEDITLSLLHRIRNKQAKDAPIGLEANSSHEPANQFHDKPNSGERTRKYMCDQDSHKFPGMDPADLSSNRKRGVDVLKTRTAKSYHDVSDEDEDDASSKTDFFSCPNSETQSQEMDYGASGWENDSGPSVLHHGSSVGSLSQGSSCDMVPAKKKAKRSPEEIAALKQQALEKRAQKEQAKQAKMKQQLEKKQHKMKEAQVQKALREAHRSYRPEECMKYVTVVIDPSLLEDTGGAALLARLQELDSKTAVESQTIPGSITWRRQVMEHNLGDDLQLNTLHQEKEEHEALIQLPTASFVDMVHTFKQEQQGMFCNSQESLREYAGNVQQILNGKALTFIVQGMEKYFRLQKNSRQRNFRSAVLGNEPPDNTAKARRKKRPIEDITTVVTRVDMEEALVDLQLHVGCNVRFVETPAEVADTVAMFTKSVAETPFKRERDKAVFSFHVDTEWAGGVKVSKDGRGLVRVWRQQLQQLRNVSPEIASSIVAAYPSPSLLLQAYEQCDTIQDARKLLQDIVIRRGEGVLATTRRVGPELSKRIHTLMTSREPDLAL